MLSPLLLIDIAKTLLSASSSSYMLYYLLYFALFFVFYAFSSPFHREDRSRFNGYVYISTVLYVWLGCAVAFHLPILHYDVKVPVSLFSPLFLASAITLLVFEGLIKLCNTYYVFHIGFRQNSIEVIQNSIILSVACCLVYSQCGSSTPQSLLNLVKHTSINDLLSKHSSMNIADLVHDAVPRLDETVSRVCTVFLTDFNNPKVSDLPTVVVFWITGISILIINYGLERLSLIRAIFVDYHPYREETSITNTLLHALKPGTDSPNTSSPRSAADDADNSATQPASSDRFGSASDFMGASFSKVHTSTNQQHVGATKGKFQGVRMTGALGAVGGGTQQRANGAVQADFDSDADGVEQPLGAPSADFHRTTSDNGSVCAFGSYYDFVVGNKRQYAYLKEILSPVMLDMVTWYALVTSYTVVDLIISLKLFLGRFDMRTLQAALPYSIQQPNERQTKQAPKLVQNAFKQKSAAKHRPGSEYDNNESVMPFYYGQFENADVGDGFWFDWQADCGDGWNPTYQIARVMAQPSLSVSIKRRGRAATNIVLPRPKLLIIGGDLAYPSPTEETYENRLFRPYECAMPPPPHYDPHALSTRKPDVPEGQTLSTYEGPQIFAIPGNHDWFDGLQTFLRYICSRDWLGGWLLPQEKSWFALKLPHGWWLFGMDNALSDDIDYHQFKYFSDIAEHMAPTDRVILMTHEPDWIVDAFFAVTTSSNIAHLIQKLRGKVVLRIAGDIHNYTRHMPILRGQRIREPHYTIFQRLPMWLRVSSVFSGLKSLTRDILDMSDNAGSNVYYDDLVANNPTKLSTSTGSPSIHDRTASQPTVKRTQSDNYHLNGFINGHSAATHMHKDHDDLTPDHAHMKLKPSNGSPRINLFDSPPASDDEGDHNTIPLYSATHRQSSAGNSNGNGDAPSPHVQVYRSASTPPHVANGYNTAFHLPDSFSQASIATSNGAAGGESVTLDTNKLSEWSSTDVTLWLVYAHLTDLCEAFASNGVDGKLLVELTEEDLGGDDLKITSTLRRKKLMLEIKSLKQSMSEGKQLTIERNFSMMSLASSHAATPHNATNGHQNHDEDNETVLPLDKSVPPVIARQNSENTEQFDAQEGVTEESIRQTSESVQQPNGNKPHAAEAVNGIYSNGHAPQIQRTDSASRRSKHVHLHVDTEAAKASKDEQDDNHQPANKQSIHWHGRNADMPSEPVMPPVLVVSGGGGAFLHPTHVPTPAPINVRGQRYTRTACYPSVPTSRNYALLNIFGFRQRNWRFDIMGVAVHFLLVVSFFPICQLGSVIHANTWREFLVEYSKAVYAVHMQLFSTAYISLLAFIGVWVATTLFTEENWPIYKRVAVGTSHAVAHSVTAICVVVFMEALIELGLEMKIVGQESLFDIFGSNFPEVRTLFSLADYYTYGFATTAAHYLTAAFDVPDAMATYKVRMCHAAADMTRWQTMVYYCSTYLYYYVLSAPLCSFVFGTYLYAANCFLNAHLTEAFSSLRIESYKNFVRFHINTKGELEIYALGIDKVPRAWKKDRQWTGYQHESSELPSYKWDKPSIWKPNSGQPDKVKLVDHLVITRHSKASARYVDLTQPSKTVLRCC